MSGRDEDIAVAQYDYSANEESELSIQKSEKLTILDSSGSWWKVRNSHGREGYVPSNYCKRPKQTLFSSLRNTLGRRKSKNYGTNGGSSNEKIKSSLQNVNDASGNGTLDSVKGLNERSPKSGNTNTWHSEGNIINQPYSDQPGVSGVEQTPNNAPAMVNRGLPNMEGNNLGIKGHHPGSSDATFGAPQAPNYPVYSPANVGDPGNAHGFSGSQQPSQGYGAVHPIDSAGIPRGSASAMLCQAKHDYVASQADELTLKRGQQIQVLEKSSDGWWRGNLLSDAEMNQVISTGWFPSNYVVKVENQKGFTMSGSLKRNAVESNSLGRSNAVDTGHMNGQCGNTGVTQGRSQSVMGQYMANSGGQAVLKANPPMMRNGNGVHPNYSPASPGQQSFAPRNASNMANSAPAEKVLTMYPFTKNLTEELSFDAGEVLEVIDKPADDPDWWKCKNVRGEVGLIPKNHVQPYYSPQNMLGNSGDTTGVLYTTTNLNNQMHPSNMPSESFNGNSGNSMPYKAGDGESIRYQYASQSGNASMHARSPWFWGSISRTECEKMLSNHGQVGEFVVRDSESHPGSLTVTMMAGQKNRNFKVVVQDGRYQIGQKVFESVDELIEHYQRHPIYKCDSEKHYLSTPFRHPGYSTAS